MTWRSARVFEREDVPSDVMPRAAVKQAMATRGEMLGCARIVSASAGPRKATVCSACSQGLQQYSGDSCHHCTESKACVASFDEEEMDWQRPEPAADVAHADDLTRPTSAHQRLDENVLMWCPRTMLKTG